MKIKGKSIFITGAGGFIGSHLTEKLIEIGAEVKALVKYNSRNDWGMLEYLPEETISQVEVINGNLRDFESIFTATKDVDIIFHLGSIIAIPYSYINPKETIETNISGTLNVLNAAKENEVEKVVHTSTSEVYGTAEYVPIDEKHPLKGQSPYSASKIGADKIVESYYLSYELPVATLRPFNTYGPRQSARAVIPTIIMQALTSKTVHLGSLHPTRDYTFVKDTANAFIKTAESDKAIGEVVNAGSNFEISIGDLALKIFSLMDSDTEITTDVERLRPEKSEVERLWCDNQKAKELLNWNPETSLEDGLRQTIEWIENNLNFYKTGIYNR
ncbi:MAG: GDP-mannose 4,6-dehydratase [Methanobacteriaceae archaeon]|nr:GDP-mannose 4,6-dehydratase [Methanobacteriaceae archaeon]